MVRNRLPFLGLMLGISAFACKHVDSGRSQVASSENGTQARSAEIQSLIVDRLSAEGGTGRAWSMADGFFDQNWLIQSPDHYWGTASKDLPIDLGCTVNDKGCDKVFLRMTCSTDADCASRNTSCQPLLSSVALPGQTAQKMCLGSGDQLLDRFYSVITSAETNLDITTLGMAAGRFEPMLVNALSVLAHKANPPQVRILMSGQASRAFNFNQPAQTLLETILKQVRAIDPANKKELSINLGYLADGYLSWNHAKIILADQSRMITGGHNFYDPDYLSDNPIFDLSLEVRGPIARSTQNYVNTLWMFVGKKPSVGGLLQPFLESENIYWGKNPPSKNVADRLVAPKNSKLTSEPKSGDTVANVIGLGRMGSFSSEKNEASISRNPSDTGIRTLIAASKKKLDLAVQDLYFKVTIPTGNKFVDGVLQKVTPGPKDPWILNELVAAVLRGVKLRVVQSDQNEGVEGYTMTNYKVAYGMLKASILEAAKIDGRFKGMSSKDLGTYVCEHVEYAPWRFTKGESLWAKQAKEDNYGRIGSHPKLIVVDDSAFYIGSHNFYDADLQEYGVVVTNAKMTAKVNAEYWDKVWSASEGEKVEDCK